jgi:hypothetical protein
MRAALFLVLLGCAEPQQMTRDEVRFARSAPGCRGVDAVEIRSRKDECPSRQMLLGYARERGANRVVLDEFTVVEARDSEVVARARLFACP